MHLSVVPLDGEVNKATALRGPVCPLEIHYEVPGAQQCVGGRDCSCFENNAARVGLEKQLINGQHLCYLNGISMYFWFCSRFSPQKEQALLL